MLETLDQVPWGRLYHSYGRADDVPDLLRALLTDDEEARYEAYDTFLNTINHQGDVMSATTAVIPFLIELLEEESVPERHSLANMLYAIAMACVGHLTQAPTPADVPDSLQTYQRVMAGWPTYLRLLSHPDAQIRKAGTELLACVKPDNPRVRLGIWRQFKAETSESLRGFLLLALARCVPVRWSVFRKSKHQLYSHLFESCLKGSNSEWMRLYAAYAWIAMRYDWQVERSLPDGLVLALAEAVIRPPQGQHFLHEHLLSDAPLEHLALCGIPGLQLALTLPGLTAHTAHQIIREMLDKTFERRPTWLAHPRALRWSEQDYTSPYHGSYIYKHHETPISLRYQPGKGLLPHQRDVLRVIVAHDLFWQLPTNLFSFYYGLPDDREELRALLTR